MSSSFKRRVIKALIYGSVMFMWISVMSKLVFQEEKWLTISIVSVTFYTIGIFVTESIKETLAYENILYGNDLLLGIFFILLMTFITGVLLSLENWFSIDGYASSSFLITLIFDMHYKD